MSILVANVKKINRTTLAATKARIFNTNRIGELKVDSSDSIFWYTDNKDDRRNSAIEYKVDETTTVLSAYYGGSGNEISVSALKKRVDGKTYDYAKTLILGLDDIVDGYADPDAPTTKSWLVCYPNAFKKIEYQINAPLGFFDGVSSVLSYKFLDSVNGADITADATGVIDYATKAIAVTVNNGATLTTLIASFVLSTGATAAVGATAQVTAVTENNFSSPVVYAVSGVDGRAINWTVTVTVAGA
jgi:hypothetical protein